MKDLKNRREVEYVPIIDNFKKMIKGINTNGITGPHLPGVGICYESAKYKFLFCGWETYGWDSLTDFVNDDTYNLVFSTDKYLNDDSFLEWRQNDHATFWAFVLKFISTFYHVDYKELIERKYPELLHSFMWANSNSIERYEVSSTEASKDNWEKVKYASKTFDDLNHIINSCQPKVVFILYKSVDENYYKDSKTLSESYGIDINNKSNYLQIRNERYSYCYRRDSQTHIFILPHPTWMGLYSGIGIEKYIDNIVTDLKTYKVWDKMPDSNEEWRMTNPRDEDKASMDYKCRIIASLAHSLTANNLVMNGKELQSIFNKNGIPTTYGTPYGENGGRGIYTVIRNAWKFYQSKKRDYQTAYDIARSFVNKNGEYAYNV